MVMDSQVDIYKYSVANIEQRLAQQSDFTYCYSLLHVFIIMRILSDNLQFVLIT